METGVVVTGEVVYLFIKFCSVTLPSAVDCGGSGDGEDVRFGRESVGDTREVFKFSPLKPLRKVGEEGEKSYVLFYNERQIVWSENNKTEERCSPLVDL